MEKKYIIVGGLPKPIGGVTTFLRRLLYWERENIDIFLDFYKGKKEALPEACSKKVINLGSRNKMLYWLFRHSNRTGNRRVLFNFSTTRSLVGLAFLLKPKNAEWGLILHHGKLRVDRFWMSIISKIALRKMDCVYALSSQQEEFFISMGVPSSIIKREVTYYEPLPQEDERDAVREIDELRTRFREIFVMSGYPTDIYNYQIAIDLFKNGMRPNALLVIFIYGEGSEREALQHLSANSECVKLYEDMSENFFNTFLKTSDCLLRLNEVDSFGIGVADAINLGVKVIATDVCNRYLGSYLLNLDNLRKNPDTLFDLIDGPEILSDTAKNNRSHFSLWATS